MNHKTRRIIEQLACERRYGIADAKGAEYSGAGSTYKETGADTLRNFKAVAERTGVTPEQALMTYLLKHIDSITTAVREAGDCAIKDKTRTYLPNDPNPREVYAKGEGIVSRLDDARNYLDLLECLLVELSHIADPDECGPDVTGCDGCDNPTCGFTECRENRAHGEPELERLRRLDANVTPEMIEEATEWVKNNVPPGDPQTADMIRGYDGILHPRSLPVDTPIIPPLCWGAQDAPVEHKADLRDQYRETGELSE